MSSLFALRALLFAGELFMGSTLIMALAWLGASQEKASARHLAWAGAFGAALLLPVLAAIMPSPIRILLSAQPPPLMQTLNASAIAAALPAPAVGGITLDLFAITLALGALWLAGACVVALRLAISAFCLAALRRHSRAYVPAPGDLPKVASTRQECELRLSDAESGPVTWGVFRPVILLPRNAVTWPRARMHAVLLHELAHIRRRDSFVQALSLFVCALYWPNPLVWMGARRLRREAEIAADDAVIVAGVRPSHYAGELLQLAAEFRARQPALSTLSLFMAAPSALEARVESLLAPTSLRSGVTSMDVLKITGLGFFAATAIAFACPSLAQDAPPAAPPPPAVDTAPLPPAAPEAPEAPPAPPAPPADANAAAPSADATPATRAEMAMPSIHVHLDDLHRLKSINVKRMRIDMARAGREARAAIERAKPEIERAMAQVRASDVQMKAGEDAMRAVRDAQPQINAAVDEALTKARPEIDRAMAEARPEIDRAMAEARAELARDHLDAKIQVRVDEALKRAEVRIKGAEARAKDSETRREERNEVTPDSPETPRNN